MLLKKLQKPTLQPGKFHNYDAFFKNPGHQTDNI